MKKNKQTATDENSHIDAKLTQKLIEEAENYKNKYLRALADYQNLEKRTASEIAGYQTRSADKILTEILEIGDSFRKLKDHLKDNGLDLVYKQYMDLLFRYNVVRIETVGKQFDPHTMDCIEIGEGQDNIVLEELETGYLRQDRVLKIAKVKVGKLNNLQN